MNISENMERAIKDYGKEAFSDHKEETYAAIKAVCLCGEFLQNLEDWGRRRASPEIGWGNTEEVWKENFFKDYDNKLRVKEIRQLKEALDGGTLQVGEKIPLKNFLCQGIILMMEEAAENLSPEQWLEFMETQMMANQYGDYQVFLEAVYVLGLLEILKYQSGVNCHYFRGDFRDAQYLLRSFRNLVPEEEMQWYDSACVGLLKELEDQRIDAMTKVLNERDRRLEMRRKENGGIPILDLFHRKMEEMDGREFEQFVKQEYRADKIWEENWGEGWKWGSELRLRAMKSFKVLGLMELFVYGDRGLKKRLFQCLPKEEKMILMEWWMAEYYPEYVYDLERRLVAMLMAAHGGWEREYEKELRDSLEKIIGRNL